MNVHSLKSDEDWAPASRGLVAELPGLLSRLSADGFVLRRVMFNPADWDRPVPRKAIVDGRTVKLGAFNHQDRQTVMVVDDDGRSRVTLHLSADALGA